MKIEAKEILAVPFNNLQPALQKHGVDLPAQLGGDCLHQIKQIIERGIECDVLKAYKSIHCMPLLQMPEGLTIFDPFLFPTEPITLQDLSLRGEIIVPSYSLESGIKGEIAYRRTATGIAAKKQCPLEGEWREFEFPLTPIRITDQIAVDLRAKMKALFVIAFLRDEHVWKIIFDPRRNYFKVGNNDPGELRGDIRTRFDAVAEVLDINSNDLEEFFKIARRAWQASTSSMT